MNKTRILITIVLVTLFVTAIVVPLYYRLIRRGPERIPEREALRLLHIELEEHFMDKHRYPDALGEDDDFVAAQEDGMHIGLAPWILLPREEVPEKVFEASQQARYGSDGKNWWILAHPGPDSELKLNLRGWLVTVSENETPYYQVVPSGFVPYDPTNGTASAGDLVRIGP